VGGVEWGKQRSLVLALHEVTFMLLRWSLLGGVPGGWGGDDDNAVDVSSSCSDIHVDPFAATFLMVHVHEVTYVLLCYTLFLEKPGLMTLLMAFAEYCKDRKKQDRTSAS